MPRSWSLALCSVIFIACGFSSLWAGPPDFEARVRAQAAIEDVYWRHRIWPSDNLGPKPALDQVLPDASLRARVEDYMLQSKALEHLWARPIHATDLQAEIDRMVASSQAPDVLRELFAALDDDPVLVAECLARPLLADRWIRSAYAREARYHSELKSAIEGSIRPRAPISEARRLGDEYVEADWVIGGPVRGMWTAGVRELHMSFDSWRVNLARLEAAFDRTGTSAEDLPMEMVGRLQEDDETFFMQALLEKGRGRLRVATVAWRKKPFDEWWAQTKDSLRAGAPPEDAAAVTTDTNAPALVIPAAPVSTCTPDTWTRVQPSGAPTIREAHTSVWTGAEMIVWGGYNGNLDTNTGSRYSPATDSWSATSTTNAPQARDTHTAVWTGTRMVIWGGGNEVFVPKNSGGRYDPSTNAWAGTAITSSTPSAREYHTAVWSGSRMVIWGGWDGTKDVDTGGRYDPAGDTWATIAKPGAPSARDNHTAVWTGTRMVVWGGVDDNFVPQNTGSRYDPVGNAWTLTSTVGAAEGRTRHTAVWTGSKMIVWGGYNGVNDLTTGGIYDPSADTWALTSTAGAPAARDMHIAVWTGSLSEMDVWGGQDDQVVQLNTGGRYNPTTNVWTAMSSLGAPVGRRFHTGVWAGPQLITWGGWNATDLNSGGGYCSGACTTPPPAGTSTISVSSEMGGSRVSWTAPPAAMAYDLVRGSLGLLLSSGGNYSTATQACLANDQLATDFLDTASPLAGDGFFYLVRSLSCSGLSTYDEGDPSQIGSRDAEIFASPNECP